MISVPEGRIMVSLRDDLKIFFGLFWNVRMCLFFQFPVFLFKAVNLFTNQCD